jgi:type II secretory pathway component GspD/PulD (secretin)
VAPASWGCERGTIQYFPLGMALVVNQTPAVQEEVRELLAALRRLQDVEVAVTVRVVKVRDSVLENFDLEPPTDARRPALLDDVQVARLLEAVQGDRASSVMQAPKMTLFNGQRAAINTTEQRVLVTGLETVPEADRIVVRTRKETVETGFLCKVRPTVSADRQDVNLSMNLSLAKLGNPQARLPVVVQVEDASGGMHEIRTGQVVQKHPVLSTIELDSDVTIPDGRTAVLFAGQDVSETVNAFGPPCKLPYVAALYRTVSHRCRVLVLVTPRVIINETEEPVFFGNLPPIPR